MRSLLRSQSCSPRSSGHTYCARMSVVMPGRRRVGVASCDAAHASLAAHSHAGARVCTGVSILARPRQSAGMGQQPAARMQPGAHQTVDLEKVGSSMVQAHSLLCGLSLGRLVASSSVLLSARLARSVCTGSCRVILAPGVSQGATRVQSVSVRVNDLTACRPLVPLNRLEVRSLS